MTFQEVSITLIKKADDFDSSKAFLPWAIGITRSGFALFLKKETTQFKALRREPGYSETQICENYSNDTLDSRLESSRAP